MSTVRNKEAREALARLDKGILAQVKTTREETFAILNMVKLIDEALSADNVKKV